jgi:CubicO group peptidase (beta-lactamase class C family)
MTDATAIPISGTCTDRFAAVGRAFADNFSLRGDHGAGVAVIHRGEVVVDLWGGQADPTGRPWEHDTLVNVWSTTKGMTAVCAHVLADRGELDLDAPVARYWPEFGAAGKDGVLVRWVLSHRAGLPGLTTPITAADYEDWDKICSLLAAQAPIVEPGTRSGYHAVTFGYLVGELVRRITGESLGQFFATEVAEPVGADVHIGLDVAEHHRVADLTDVQMTAQMAADMAAAFANVTPAGMAALTNPMLEPTHANTPGWRAAEIPAANGHATARGLAAVYAGVVDGRLLGPPARERARTIQVTNPDEVLLLEVSWGLGFIVSDTFGNYGPNPGSFGHDGWGGSFAMADPENELAVAWVMNRMGASLNGDPRKLALIEAVYASLDA